MVGVLFSRCGEGWLWVSRGSSGLRGDPPSVAPSEAQRAGHLKMPLRFPILEALRKIGAMAYALRHADHRISQVSHHCRLLFYPGAVLGVPKLRYAPVSMTNGILTTLSRAAAIRQAHNL